MEPTTIAALFAGLALIIGALGKILVDVRAGNRETHNVKVLVDGRMTAALHHIAMLARSIAKLTHDPEDIKTAEDAEREYTEKRLSDLG